MKKKALSLALVLVMCSTLLPTVVLAADKDGFIIENGVLMHYKGEQEKVVIPSNVTEIGGFAFINSKVKQVELHDGIISIGKCAFYGSSLESITIPDSVTTITSLAFQQCAQLKSATIGNGVTNIEYQTFYGCTNLEELHIGNGVEAIGSQAFSRCSSLTSLIIPENVSFIEGSAFYGCSSLSDLTISPSTVCDPNAFSGCPNLPKGLVPSNTVEEIWGGEETRNGDFVIHGSTLTKYVGSSKDVVIPEGITAIAASAFYECSTMESVTIANTVKQIDRCAFCFCPNLETIIFPTPDKLEPSLKHISFTNMIAKAPIREIINCPDPLINEKLDANEHIRNAWIDADPSVCILPQSQPIATLSNQICAGQTSDYTKAKAIYSWITENIEYDYPYYYGKKDSTTILPEEVLSSKLTVCDGYSRLTQALLQAQNIPTVRIVGTATGRVTSAGSNHAWNMAYVDGRWIYIDTTWGREANYDPRDGKPEYFTTDAWFDPTPMYISLSHLGKSSTIDPNGYDDDTPWTTAPVTDTSNSSTTDENSIIVSNGYHGDTSRPTVSAAIPNSSTVLVNGKAVTFDAYTINQNNYFKLRDLAKVLSGTEKQFEVTWDGSKNAINMTSGLPYTVVGGEMTPGDGTDKTANLNTSIIYLNGQPIQLTAYTINENNYFKLRDIGATFDFDVTWDGARNTIVIDTTQNYTAD